MSNTSNSPRTPESSQSSNSSHSFRMTTLLAKINGDATPKVKEVATLLPREKFPKAQTNAKDRQQETAKLEAEHNHEDSANNASVGNERAKAFQEYKLFPVEHEQRFPTYASVFGQPKYMNPFADEDAQKHRKGGIQSTYDGKFSNIPATVLKDRYGMMGLLSIMRTAKSLPEMTLLSLGDDLESYGFDLNSEDLLYCNFNGPYTNEPPPKYFERGLTCDEALKKLRLGSTPLNEDKRK